MIIKNTLKSLRNKLICIKKIFFVFVFLLLLLFLIYSFATAHSEPFVSQIDPARLEEYLNSLDETLFPMYQNPLCGLDENITIEKVQEGYVK